MASGGYSNKTGMNENQKRFADTYLSNGYNATQAYSSVFPNASYNTCKNNAYALLRKPAVAEYVAARRKEIYDSLAIDAEHVAQKLAEIAFAAKDDKDYVVHRGDKICQAVFTKYLTVDDEEEIENVRVGGFGSTDNKN